MSDSILIIDSSDEEVESPKKKIKTQHVNGVKDEDQTLGLKIIQVTSLAEKSACDIIEIDSDDDCKENKNSGKIKKNGESSTDIMVIDEFDPLSENNNAISPEFQNFLDVCSSCTENGKYKDLINAKIQSIKIKYSEAVPEYVQSKNFVKLLETSTEKVKKKPINAIIYFRQVYEELKSRKCATDLDLNEKQEFYLAKLRKTMRLLDKKIKKLENKEVNFDDENDSTYIMLDRYKRRFVDVHKKYCSYTKEDMYAGRVTHRKLDFNASKFPEINRAIDRLYHKERKFPLYHEVDSCIRKCVSEKGINLKDVALDLEIRKMHQEMGKLVQRRRKCELEDIHTHFLGTTTDPAIEDPDLNKILDEQDKVGEQKMEELFQSFTKRQLEGDEPTVSSDSDDSNEVSEPEQEEKEEKTKE